MNPTHEGPGYLKTGWGWLMRDLNWQAAAQAPCPALVCHRAALADWPQTFSAAGLLVLSLHAWLDSLLELTGRPGEALSNTFPNKSFPGCGIASSVGEAGCCCGAVGGTTATTGVSSSSLTATSARAFA